MQDGFFELLVQVYLRTNAKVLNFFFFWLKSVKCWRMKEETIGNDVHNKKGLGSRYFYLETNRKKEKKKSGEKAGYKLAL